MLPPHGHLIDYKNGKEVSGMIWRHYDPHNGLWVESGVGI